MLWLTSMEAEGAVNDEFSAARLCMAVMIFLIAQFSRFRFGPQFFATGTEGSNWTVNENPECHLLSRLKCPGVPKAKEHIDE